MLEVKIKKIVPGAVIPSYAHSTDAAMDLTAVNRFEDEHGNACYSTGLAIQIPEGHVGLLFPRSSISKTALSLCNSVGVIDPGYTGEIIFKFRNYRTDPPYLVGDRVGQLLIIPRPTIQFVEVDVLDASERGEGGFGSTGK